MNHQCINTKVRSGDDRFFPSLTKSPAASLGNCGETRCISYESEAGSWLARRNVVENKKNILFCS
jgi:hypothetical protein